MRKLSLFLFAIVLSINVQAQLLPEIEDLGLWCVYIETVNGEEPTCDVLSSPDGCWGESITNMNKVPCRLFLTNGGGDILYDSGCYEEKKTGAVIRVRGNTSASQFEKKPYKIKLQKKADLLCRDDSKYDDKDWLLIKNWGIRGLVGFRLNEMLGLPYAPKFQYVNVVLNGCYKGTYLLCESISRNTDCRIIVSKKGYIFEYDAYWWKEDFYVRSNYNIPMHYTFKYPDTEDLTPEIIDSFSDYINNVECSLKNGDYDRYLDLDTFVLWLIGQDILGNYDSAGSNIFLSKYDDGDETQIQIPCLWDFDGIMGSEDRLPNIFANIHYSFYFQDLFADSRFIERYIDTYERLSTSIYSDMLMMINEFVNSDYGRAYKRSFEKDQIMWDFYTQHNISKSFEEWVDLSVDWFSYRKSILDAAVAQLKATNSIPFTKLRINGRQILFDLNGRKNDFPKKGVNIVGNRKRIVN